MHAQRGVSLVEALVALVVMAFGMLAIVGLQGNLRFNADAARQRSEAVRIAQAEMERLRAFASLTAAEGVPSYAAINNTTDAIAVQGFTSNTSYLLNRSVNEVVDPAHKRLRVWVQWADRTGGTQHVELNSVIAGTDPAVAGALAKRPYGNPGKLPGGRHAGIPLQARDLGDGTSAFKPSAHGTVVWVFSNSSAAITRVCSVADPATSNAALTTQNVVSCSNVDAHLLAGTVRVADGNPLNAALAESPDGTALNLDIDLVITSTGHPSPAYACFDDAPSTLIAAAQQSVVSYYCAIYANNDGKWSGRAEVVPAGFTDVGRTWEIDTRGGDKRKRICRYTTLSTDTGANLQHPYNYVDAKLSEPLLHQNFLIIDGNRQCPSDTAANPAQGDYVNSNTRQHQPAS